MKKNNEKEKNEIEEVEPIEPEIIKEKGSKGLVIAIILLFVAILVMVIVIAVLNTQTPDNGACDDNGCVGVIQILGNYFKLIL